MIAKGKRVKLSMKALYSRCTISGDCKLWGGALSRQGYPYVTDPEKAAKRTATGKGGAARGARVVVWRLTRGEEPSGRIVMTCWNRLCLNPAHMLCVSEAERQQMMKERGCYDTVKHRTARIANSRRAAKLSTDIAEQLRRELGHLKPRQKGRLEAVNEAAQRLNVTPGAVYGVLRGESWKKLTAPNSSVWSMAA